MCSALSAMNCDIITGGGARRKLGPRSLGSCGHAECEPGLAGVSETELTNGG
jgi:hypothetical protein